MSEVQAPIIKDATGQSMLTQLTAMVTKLQGIIDGLTPVASQIGLTTTGMHVITEDEVQGALTEVDTALNNINSSLTPKETGAISIPQTQAGESAVITIDVSSAPASIGIIGGWQISSASHVAIGTCRMTDLNTISVRIVNNYSSTTSADAKIRVVYL